MCHLLISTVYKTIELTIANHPVMKMSNFTIGPCVFYDQLIMERKHTLDQYGTWTIFQLCIDSIIQFDARCGLSRSCTTDMLCPAMSVNATSTQGEHETTSTQGEPRQLAHKVNLRQLTHKVNLRQLAHKVNLRQLAHKMNLRQLAQEAPYL